MTNHPKLNRLRDFLAQQPKSLPLPAHLRQNPHAKQWQPTLNRGRLPAVSRRERAAA